MTTTAHSHSINNNTHRSIYVSGNATGGAGGYFAAGPVTLTSIHPYDNYLYSVPSQPLSPVMLFTQMNFQNFSSSSSVPYEIIRTRNSNNSGIHEIDLLIYKLFMDRSCLPDIFQHPSESNILFIQTYSSCKYDLQQLLNQNSQLQYNSPKPYLWKNVSELLQEFVSGNNKKLYPVNLRITLGSSIPSKDELNAYFFIEEYCKNSKWIYSNTMCFENESDAIAFKMFAKENNLL